MVFTHGTLWYRVTIRWRSRTLRAWFVSKKWLRTRKLAALASPIAHAVAGVHGKTGRPSTPVITGPYSVDHSVRERSSRSPPAVRAVTVTGWGVMARGWPSTR